MNPVYIVLALVPISVGLRYLVEEDQAARRIGVKLASPEYRAMNKSGHQVAVMIPQSNKWFFLSVALILGGLAWLAFAYDWQLAVIGLLTSAGSGVFAQLFLPTKDSRHFLLRISGSMARRYADYERDGDKVRAEAMRYLLDRCTTEYGQAMMTGKSEEKIISKSDADYIFSLDRAGWESYAERMTHPGGWEIRLTRHDTGTAATTIDPSTAVAVSTQPLYGDNAKPPMMVIVRTLYPKGRLRPFTPKLKAKIERDAQNDLGTGYIVKVTSPPPFEGVEGIELTVRRSGSP